jgi:hypothetical protein
MADAKPRPEEKRKHPRIKTNLRGRYMLANRREFACTIVDVSIGGIAVSGPERGAIGAPVIVYMDELGRVEGEIVRFLDEGFALQLTTTTAAADKYARRLIDLQANASPRGQDRRREPRVKLDESTFMVTESARTPCEIIDLSLTGADIRVSKRPSVGAVVQLGRVHGLVVRHSVAGVAIEFVEPAGHNALTERLQDITMPVRRSRSAAA